jgi:hypothetical protein
MIRATWESASIAMTHMVSMRRSNACAAPPFQCGLSWPTPSPTLYRTESSALATWSHALASISSLVVCRPGRFSAAAFSATDGSWTSAYAVVTGHLPRPGPA